MAKEKVKTNYKLQRFLEMLPGSITWLVILFPIWGAFFIPRVVAYFTIAFLVFWLYRSFQSGILGIRGYVKIRRSEKTDWKKKYLEEKCIVENKLKELDTKTKFLNNELQSIKLREFSRDQHAYDY